MTVTKQKTGCARVTLFSRLQFRNRSVGARHDAATHSPMHSPLSVAVSARITVFLLCPRAVCIRRSAFRAEWTRIPMMTGGLMSVAAWHPIPRMVLRALKAAGRRQPRRYTARRQRSTATQTVGVARLAKRMSKVRPPAGSARLRRRSQLKCSRLSSAEGAAGRGRQSLRRQTALNRARSRLRRLRGIWQSMDWSPSILSAMSAEVACCRVWRIATLGHGHGPCFPRGSPIQRTSR